MSFIQLPDETTAGGRSRTYQGEVRIALSAIDSVLHGEKALYASSELTTGRRLYDLFRQYEVESREELCAKMGEETYRREVWDPYVAEATALASMLRLRLGGELVLTPAPFEAPGWSQPEYLAFWETVIRTRLRGVYFSLDWEYSNGCTFEFAVARDAGLATFEEGGQPLSREEGRDRIVAAIADLEGQGLKVPGLRENLARLGERGGP